MEREKTIRRAPAPLVEKVFQNTTLLCLVLVLALGCLFSFAPQTSAQDPLPSPESSTSLSPSPTPSSTATVRAIDKPELHQALHDLTNPWTVMCVASHPDDEDGTTLTILRRKHGIHTVSLFSTYGEGGQNAVGPELYEELGVIRARETIEASKIQGSEPYFLGLRDFGFSKSAEETFRVWGHDEALRRMVLTIRELRPDIIITNHDTSRGHGHHQATGRLILEAFDAAADPKRFPEQLQRLTVWQPSRLFVRSRTAGGAGTPSPSTAKTEKLITVDPNERDPVRGTIYAEQALAALQQHASQGPWPKTIAERMRGENSLPIIRYALVREAQGAEQLPGGAKSFLEGLSLPEAISERLAPPTIDDRALTEFIEEPNRVLDALIGWRRKQRNLTNVPAEHSHRQGLTIARGNRALGLTSGITLTLKSHNSLLVPGSPARFTVSLANTGERTVQIKRLSFHSWGTREPLDAADQLVADKETSNTVDLVTPTTAMPTVPPAQHLYDGKLFGERFVADADLEIDGAWFSLSAETRLDIAPAVEIKEISPSLYVFTPAIINRPLVLKIKLSNNLAKPFRGTVKLSAPTYIFEAAREVILEPNETRELTIRSNAIPMERAATRRRARDSFGQFLLSVESEGSSQPIAQRFLPVVYSESRVVRDLRIGFIPSFDKTLEQSLTALGVNAKELSIEQIQKGELADYDTLIIDNRGYQAHPELIPANSNLLSYVREGGTLIVFYHKTDEWNPDPAKGRPQLAPFPIILGNERVTQETAPVKFLEPEHRLLNFPNRITRADFDRWIQERGLYFPKEWDPKYQTLFETADQGGPPLKGGLLAAKYGRGYYVYTSLVWYRQLGAGVPGAYRMFANIISYGNPKKKNQPRPLI